MIASSGYQHTFLVFAIIYGVIIVVVSNFIRAPRAHDVPATIKIKVAQGDSGSAAVAGATVADVLDHVSDVLPGRRRRPNVGGAACSDCPRTRHRQYADHTVWGQHKRHRRFVVDMPKVVATLRFKSVFSDLKKMTSILGCLDSKLQVV